MATASLDAMAVLAEVVEALVMATPIEANAEKALLRTMAAAADPTEVVVVAADVVVMKAEVEVTFEKGNLLQIIKNLKWS